MTGWRDDWHKKNSPPLVGGARGGGKNNSNLVGEDEGGDGEAGLALHALGLRAPRRGERWVSEHGVRIKKIEMGFRHMRTRTVKLPKVRPGVSLGQYCAL